MYVSADTISGHPLSGSGDYQVPRPLKLAGSNTRFHRAMTPAATVIHKNASHVLVNNSGSYHFAYDCDSAVDHYELGIHIAPGAQAGVPVRLDISPCAWSGSALNNESACTTGDVTFVYKGY